MAKAKENVVFLDDKEIKVADLTDEQKYYHSQVVDLRNQKARISFQLDQWQGLMYGKTTRNKSLDWRIYCPDYISFPNPIAGLCCSCCRELLLLKFSSLPFFTPYRTYCVLFVLIPRLLPRVLGLR